MLMACICGGTIEILMLAGLTGFATMVSSAITIIQNRRLRKKRKYLKRNFDVN